MTRKNMKPQKKKVRLLTIKRSKWLRGDGCGRLLNKRGQMCCLGFACLQLAGATEDMIANLYVPSDVAPVLDQTIALGLSENIHDDTEVAMELQVANDDPALNERVRESRITKLFAKIGVKVRFVE